MLLPLTTVGRLMAFGDLGGKDGTTPPRQDVALFLPAIILGVSKKFEQYCNRAFGIQPYTEQRTARTGVFHPTAQAPVVSCDSVQWAPGGPPYSWQTVDPSRTGIAHEAMGIAISWECWGQYLVSYHAGIANSTDTVTFSATLASGTFSAGPAEDAFGRVANFVSFDGATVTIQAISPTIGTTAPGPSLVGGGTFSQGDTITTSGWTLTLGAQITKSVINDYPDLELAALMQCYEEHQRKTNASKTSTDLGEGRTQWNAALNLLPSVKEVLNNGYFRKGAFV